MRIHKILVIILLFLVCMTSKAQQNNIPAKVWNNDKNKPIVLYLTGDGGFNSFSNTYCDLLSKEGYTVAAINSKSYFWDKKSADKITKDLSAYLTNLVKEHSNQAVYFVGYSFGADVVPFVVNRLSAIWKQKLKAVTLLEPSTSTDLEIHIADLLSRSDAKRDFDVIAEINRMLDTKVTILLGDDEVNFPIKQIKLKNFQISYLKGGHHFDGNALQVVKATIKNWL